MFENCVNTGDILTHRQYGGGILAYSQENVTFKNCVNTGDVSGDRLDYYGACNKYDKDKTRYPLGKCHDNGNKNYYYCGGILGRANYDVKAYDCLNTGDISGNHSVGGIVGEAGSAYAKGITGTHEFVRCLNTGDIYNNNKHNDVSLAVAPTKAVGGIFGTCFNDSAVAVTGILVESCGSVGTIEADNTRGRGEKGIAGIGGYADAAKATYTNVYFGGTLVDNGGLGLKVGVICAHTIEVKNSQIKNALITNNNALLYADVEKTVSSEGKTVTRDAVASGELCYLLNKAAGKTVFYQQIGVDAQPTPIKGEKEYVVYYDWANDVYTNEFVADKPVETTAPAEDTTEPAPVVTEPTVTEPTVTEPVVTEPEVTEPEVTEPEVTEPVVTEPEVTDPVVTDPVVTDPVATDPAPVDEGGCGSVIGASVALVALAIVAPAGILLKKRDEE